MQFSNVLGHVAIKDKLSQLIGEGKLPHALLLLGPEGCGALPLALAIAQNLVCEKRHGKTENTTPSLFGELVVPMPAEKLKDACGECAACQKAAKFIHPDIHFSFPTIKEEKTEALSRNWIKEWRKALSENPYMGYHHWLGYLKAENKQGNITVRECQEIIQQLTLKTYEAQYKIQLIWLAEYLGSEGNVLLKTLEEPPDNTIIILIAESAELVLNTILSRTQIIKLPALEDEVLAAHLQAQYEMDSVTALRLARISDGNLNAAIQNAEGCKELNDTLLQEWLSVCLRLKMSGYEATASEKLVSITEQLTKLGRENQKIFLKYFLWLLRETHLLTLGLTSEKLEGTELDFARKLAKLLDTMSIQQLEKIVNDLHYHIERNGNPKILFFANSFKLSRVFRQYTAVET